MKIKEAHMHLSVPFGYRKTEHRHFSTENSRKFKNLNMELIDGLGIRIRDDEDDVIVPMLNVVSFRVQPDEEAVVQPTEAEKQVLGLDEPDEEELEQVVVEEELEDDGDIEE